MRTHPNEFERLQLRYYCTTCRAMAQQWCVTRSGRWTQFLHAPRFYRATEYRRAVAKVTQR